MDREKFLQSIKDSLEARGFSVDDLVQYCARESPSLKEKSPSTGSSLEEERFPFEVMYEGMVRSWSPLKGKKPLGVIFENHLVTLHDSPEAMIWKKAMEYCQVEIEGCACDAGEIEFWDKLVKLSEQQKQAFDELMVRLGGEPIALSDEWFWSSSFDYYDTNYNYYWIVNPVSGDTNDGWEYANFYVRPVLALS